MCKICKEECLDIYGEVLDGYRAIYCKDVGFAGASLIEPQHLKSPKERFNKQQFGILLCQLRESRKLTQAEAAQRVGISRRTWNAIEAGKSSPRIDVVAAIAETFDKSVEEFFKL